MSPHVPHPLARSLRALHAISDVHSGTPLFKILDPPLLSSGVLEYQEAIGELEGFLDSQVYDALTIKRFQSFGKAMLK